MTLRRGYGFTLIEVLVALGIVAIALTAGLRATAALSRNAERQTEVMLAQLCADNELVKLRVAKQMPGVGDSTVACEQAGRQFNVLDQVRPTPNPNFLRIDAVVQTEGHNVYQVSTVMGRY
jgi:general secretion pathway protein I